MIDDATLGRIEREHPAGLGSAEILDLLATHGVPLSEATLRKYVQLGLLPRSVRVGRKGKHQGSQGLYPATLVRQILRIKQMIAQSFTIEQIQREFLFMKGDLEQLERTLTAVWKALDRVLKERRGAGYAQAVARDVSDARVLGKELLARLRAIEDRLTARARIDHVAAS